jgi:hypothetical protein
LRVRLARWHTSRFLLIGAISGAEKLGSGLETTMRASAGLCTNAEQA